MSGHWKPSEIIIDRRVKNDPVTRSIIEKCQSVPIRYVSDAKSKTIVEASDVLASSGNTMLDKIIAGKKVLFVAPASDSRIATKTKEDDRIICPAYDQLKYASNGCFYQCDWCFLKITYRANQPYITVYADYDRIIKKLEKNISDSSGPIMFSSGDLADSLALEHLTGAARKFIPWFGKTDKGYLSMLTKSDNVDEILDLNHNGHTQIVWSINNDRVSRKFEKGAPPFGRRLIAAQKVQSEGYPVSIRLDPIVPINGWEKDYTETVKNIFDIIQPDKITLGTLRFEPEFYNLRNHIFAEGSELPKILEDMQPMFETKLMSNGKKSVGKYSYTEEKRIEIYNLIIKKIRKYSNCPIDLCKESARVWDESGLDRSKCSCVCQYNCVDMSQSAQKN